MATVKTRILILSDTHGDPLPTPTPSSPVDVAIHCGDLTQHSLLSEFHTTIQLLRDTRAHLKLAIAGNHDFSLDLPFLHKKFTETKRISNGAIDDALLEKGYGKDGDARALFEDAREDNIFFLDEGTHTFTLKNGARLTVYASPYTPSWPGLEDSWGFQYSGAEHEFDIKEGTDIVITHGPPQGIFDMTPDKRRAGCPALFEAVARAGPKVHCFGHTHSGWGAKLAAWRPKISKVPTHFTDIDHGKSTTVTTLAKLADEPDENAQDGFYSTSHCAGDPASLGPDRTLFVNAAIMGEEQKLEHLPWLIDLELSRAVDV